MTDDGATQDPARRSPLPPDALAALRAATGASARFSRRHYRAGLARALVDAAPDNPRLCMMSIVAGERLARSVAELQAVLAVLNRRGLGPLADLIDAGLRREREYALALAAERALLRLPAADLVALLDGDLDDDDDAGDDGNIPALLRA